ncbi:hypothetical protein GL213_10375 [Halogeometricum borinquense]|uniref:Uncharacterized protein n=1 Tax=Halogeometricum borinquense TaxID=60847 RepID=A0A6C0UIN0_9EURY|nr:hypothetical protein [Halogeometricum borinquense]QIB72788.1 hypothetical protein G3I44_05300 [Halogeometricum borinquense]QIQ75064.1 hypothetical protein GL213_10375 [Halogeometricum borinquense]
MIVPLFPGIPGSPELMIMLLMSLLYFVVPIFIIVAIYNYLDGKRAYDERITELEQRVAELEDRQS